MLSRDEVEDLLQRGHEARGVEFKGPGERGDAHFFGKVARAALSLGNLRDGGYIFIGIEDAYPASLGPGLDPAQLTSWVSYDDVARKMSSYADPPLRFRIAPIELTSGANIVLVQVDEFEDVPHLCAKQLDPVLRKGALYVRSRHVPETAEVATSVEMRDVIDLATEKALRRYLRTAEGAGLSLTTEPTAIEHYAEQLERAWG